MDKVERKLSRLRGLLATRGLEAMLLQRVSSFAWATCGAASYVNSASTNGSSALLVTPGGRYLLTSNIEAPRLEREEGLAAQGWELRVRPWHRPDDLVAGLTGGLRLAADGPYPGATDLSQEMARLRARLGPEESERFRELGRLCAEAMDCAARAVRPGQTEHEIAGRLAQEAQKRGVLAIVNLVAADERVFDFRHPLPTGKELERYAMLVLGGRRRGLVCSLTRLVHFGPLPDELRRKAEAVARVDATFLFHSRPGRALRDIFSRAMAAYAEGGFGDEWQLHHQGGVAAYESREYLATPDSTDVLEAGQACAWNPSVAGYKSEDTILAGEGGCEVLTAISGWPALAVTVDGQTIPRPAILELT
jgi:Xaa-Pro aminopeptidase